MNLLRLFLILYRFLDTPDPEIQATRNTSYLTASKSLNGRKIARMAPILTIFGPNRSQRRNLFFEKFSNERRRHRGIVVVVIVAVVVAVVAVVAVVVVGRFWVACIKGTSLQSPIWLVAIQLRKTAMVHRTSQCQY